MNSSKKHIDISFHSHCLSTNKAMYLTDRLGRRIPMISLFTIAGLSLIVVASLNASFSGSSSSSSSTAPNFYIVMGLIFVGKLGISGTYGLVVLFVTEIFPTNIRSKSLGICTLGARMGSIWSPYAVVSVIL